MADASSPYVKDPLSARYVAGGLREAEALFGSPLPVLPPSELERGRSVFFVRFHPHLRTILRRFLQTLLSQLEAETTSTPPPESNHAQTEYEQTLRRIILSARTVDRRTGLVNLFWLSHARDVADCLADLERKAPVVETLKRILPPLLAPLYRRVDAGARRKPPGLDAGETDLDSFKDGGPENVGLLPALTEDGYCFVETDVAELDLERFIVANRRLRYTAKLFLEIEFVLVRETERRLNAAEAGLLARMSRHLPGLPRGDLHAPANLRKIALNTQVMAYLLADPWSTGPALLAAPAVKDAAARRPPSEIIGGFLDLVDALKRFEILCHLGDTVRLGQGLFAEEELDERVRGGSRVYEFGEAAQVLNNAVNATVLFLDLRGFTETSEGQVSERDLTQELYSVFDVFVPIIRRFGGLVDKFLGDGMMVTFGTVVPDPGGPLNAVRTAILCQEALQELRERGHSEFRMGVSVHYGRVYVARFLEDERATQVTVIGRNVNLSGRLSSASKKAVDEDETVDEAAADAPALRVTVDARGGLVNEGIVLSRAALVQIEAQVKLDSEQEGDLHLMHYGDDELGRRVMIRYGGDAKFKGVRASFPVFEVAPQAED